VQVLEDTLCNFNASVARWSKELELLLTQSTNSSPFMGTWGSLLHEKNPPPVAVWSQMSPVNIFTPFFPEIHFNVVPFT
jgi:hypothetical protein